MRIVVIQVKKEAALLSEHLELMKQHGLIPLAIADGNQAVVVRIDDEEKKLEFIMEWEAVEQVNEITGMEKKNFLDQFTNYGMVQIAI